MKKLLMSLLCCFMLAGCQTAPEVSDCYHTDELVEKTVGDIRYSLPGAWADNSVAISENTTFYQDENLMLMVQLNESVISSFDELTAEEEEESRQIIADSFRQTYQKYENETSETIMINGIKAFEFKADVRIDNRDKDMKWIMMNVNYKTHVFGMLTDKGAPVDYSQDYESLKVSIALAGESDGE